MARPDHRSPVGQVPAGVRGPTGGRVSDWPKEAGHRNGREGEARLHWVEPRVHWVLTNNSVNSSRTR